MLRKPSNALPLLFLAGFFLIGKAASQEKPDRPPWEQPSQPPRPASTSTNTPPPTPVNSGDYSPDPAPATSQERGKIKVNVNLVSVLVSVLDDKNRPSPDLPQQAFQLFEEGVQQKIEVFEPETQQPLDLALMIDASLSAHKEISFEQEAAAHFIRQVLRPGDRLGVFSFDENVTQLAAFSDHVASLQEAVRRIPPGAGTSIYDAVVLGAHALEKRSELDRRRVIVMVTDAGETTSHSEFEEARKAAVRSGALLYTIVIRPVKSESGRNTAGEHALETMTDTTGGAMFYPDSPADLGIIFDRIDRELRTQYRLAYYPNPRGPANTYRNLEVKVFGGDYHVRHRKTYFTGPQ